MGTRRMAVVVWFLAALMLLPGLVFFLYHFLGVWAGGGSEGLCIPQFPLEGPPPLTPIPGEGGRGVPPPPAR
jgi:hypothetical protein